jgi:hypothetical protein
MVFASAAGRTARTNLLQNQRLLPIQMHQFSPPNKRTLLRHMPQPRSMPSQNILPQTVPHTKKRLGREATQMKQDPKKPLDTWQIRELLDYSVRQPHFHLLAEVPLTEILQTVGLVQIDDFVNSMKRPYKPRRRKKE